MGYYYQKIVFVLPVMHLYSTEGWSWSLNNYHATQWIFEIHFRDDYWWKAFPGLWGNSNSPAISWDGRTEASDKNVLMITYIYDWQVNRNLPLSVSNGWLYSWCHALLVHPNYYVSKARFSLLSYSDYRILWSSVKMY